MKKFSVMVALGLAALVTTASFAAPKTKKAPTPPKTKISAKQAIKIALKKYPGKVVGKVPLENEEGKWQFAVTVKGAKAMNEVMVDATSGKIANVEPVTAAGEAKEAAAEKKGGKPEPKEKGETD